MKELRRLDDEIAIYEKELGQSNNTTTHGTTTILMKKMNGVFYIPCKINGVQADFVFDTGAGAISLSTGFAQTLMSRGVLSEPDFRGNNQVKNANGIIYNSTVVNIKDVEIGGLHLRNVLASILEQQNAPLLLGQSAIQKLGKITIDGNKLIIHTE